MLAVRARRRCWRGYRRETTTPLPDALQLLTLDGRLHGQVTGTEGTMLKMVLGTMLMMFLSYTAMPRPESDGEAAVARLPRRDSDLEDRERRDFRLSARS